ncbi:glycerol-3-phosphate acyltransferase [Rhodobacterales bacterium HKCCE2091]|nr:glycerol-3-phosphate acyltransferase [Rhodobacterales bacterium HKCCE2091]
MFRPVELPLWLFALILLFAGVTFASHFLFPSVRWYLRRRLERAVARLNKRLKRPIQPFKLARRRDTIRRLLYDPEVAQAVIDHARENGVREDVAHETAERYAREIVPGFSAFAYFGLAIRLARWFSKSLFQVRLTETAPGAIEGIAPEATVVFVINHRSNMDYVLVTWLAADSSALAYAVGEWARVWPLRPLVRAMGGYFIRRRHNNPLYRKVLARYVQLATAGGVTQAVFPEGGLSLTGRLAPPKVGLLSYIIDGFDPGGDHPDVVFVPVAINYDRVMEDRVLIRASEQGNRRFRFSIRPIWRYLRRQIWLRLTLRPHRYGIAAVAFGRPTSLSGFLRQGDADPAARLGQELMDRIAAIMPVTPVPLVALGLSRGIRTRPELREWLIEQADALEGAGMPVHLPADPDATLDAGLRAFSERHLLTETAGRIELAEGAGALVAFYGNSLTLPETPAT